MNYDYTTAAEALGVSEAWLRDRTPKELPHIKYGGRGGRVVFTDEHLDEIRARFERNSSKPAAPTKTPLRPVTRRRSS